MNQELEQLKTENQIERIAHIYIGRSKKWFWFVKEEFCQFVADSQEIYTDTWQKAMRRLGIVGGIARGDDYAPSYDEVTHISIAGCIVYTMRDLNINTYEIINGQRYKKNQVINTEKLPQDLESKLRLSIEDRLEELKGEKQ